MDQSGRLALVISAFTVAHSLTLGLAAMGWIRPPNGMVEALIALSIAYVGVVSILRPRSPHGPIIAFGFGLVHGFGFAGALAQTLGDVEGRSWLLALASFNIGIEAFQLALVAMVYPVLKWGNRLRYSVTFRAVLSMLVIALGLWWTVQRVMFAG